MKKDTAKQILKQVRTHYNTIGEQFSQTRQKAWLEFEIYKELVGPNQRVLDIGCGNGRLYWQALKERDVRYIGVDISKTLLEAAAESKKSLSRKEKYRVQFKEANMLKLPFKDKKFDRTFCIAAFHHLPGTKQRIKGLKEMIRVTKKDGYVIVSVWNLFQKKYRKHVLRSIWRYIKTFGKYDWNDTFFDWGTNDGKGKGRYYHAFTPWEMRHLLRSLPLEIVEEFFVSKESLDESLLKAHNFVWICRRL